MLCAGRRSGIPVREYVANVLPAPPDRGMADAAALTPLAYKSAAVKPCSCRIKPVGDGGGRTIMVKRKS